MFKIADLGPRLTVTITPEEKQLAKDSKAEFKAVLKELKAAIEIVLDLRDSILEQRPSKEDLSKKYKGRLLRYKRKIVKAFNIFLHHLQTNLGNLAKINDPDMIRLREILAAEVSELRDGVEAVLDLLHDAGKDNFTQLLEQLTAQLEKRQHSIGDAVANQLFNHLDHDLLGRMRISELRFRTQKRSRLLLMLVKNSTSLTEVIEEPDDLLGAVNPVWLNAVRKVKRYYKDGRFDNVPPGQKAGFIDWMERRLSLNSRNRQGAGVISALLVLAGIIEPNEAAGNPESYRTTLWLWEEV